MKYEDLYGCYAVMYRRFEMLEKYMQDKKQWSNNMVCSAVKMGHIDLIKKAKDKLHIKLDISPENNVKIMTCAIEYGDTDNIKELVKMGYKLLPSSLRGVARARKQNKQEYVEQLFSLISYPVLGDKGFANTCMFILDGMIEINDINSIQQIYIQYAGRLHIHLLTNLAFKRKREIFDWVWSQPRSINHCGHDNIKHLLCGCINAGWIDIAEQVVGILTNNIGNLARYAIRSRQIEVWNWVKRKGHLQAIINHTIQNDTRIKTFASDVAANGSFEMLRDRDIIPITDITHDVIDIVFERCESIGNFDEFLYYINLDIKYDWFTLVRSLIHKDIYLKLLEKKKNYIGDRYPVINCMLEARYKNNNELICTVGQNKIPFANSNRLAYIKTYLELTDEEKLLFGYNTIISPDACRLARRYNTYHSIMKKHNCYCVRMARGQKNVDDIIMNVLS